MTDTYELLTKSDVILEGHFKLSSGRHSNVYINKDSIYRKHNLFYEVVLEIIHKIKNSGVSYDIVTGPAIAGAILAAPVSLSLRKTFIYPEKFESKMEFRRGYNKALNGKRVFIIEDIITTGSSVQKTVNAINDNNGIVVGVISIWNRTNWKLDNCINLTLINRPVESWTEEKCPICNDENNRTPLRDPKIYV